MEIWLAAGSESIAYSPIRFSQTTTVRLHNCLGRPLRFRSRWIDEAETTGTIADQVQQEWTQPDLKQRNPDHPPAHAIFLEPP